MGRELKHLQLSTFLLLFDPFAYGFGNRSFLHPQRLFNSSSESSVFSEISLPFT